MPECGAIARAKRHHISRRVAREHEAGVGRQHARSRACAELMIPANLAALVIDRSEYAIAIDAVVRAGPAVRAVFRLIKIDPVGIARAYDEETGPRIEAG